MNSLTYFKPISAADLQKKSIADKNKRKCNEFVMNSCKKMHYISENPYTPVSRAIPCYTQGCSNCIYNLSNDN